MPFERTRQVEAKRSMYDVSFSRRLTARDHSHKFFDQCSGRHGRSATKQSLDRYVPCAHRSRTFDQYAGTTLTADEADKLQALTAQNQEATGSA